MLGNICGYWRHEAVTKTHRREAWLRLTLAVALSLSTHNCSPPSHLSKSAIPLDVELVLACSKSGYSSQLTGCSMSKEEAYIHCVICMTPKSISNPPTLISAHVRAISSVISPNQYHMTSGHFFHFSVSFVPSIMIHPCYLLVLVLLLDTSALCAPLQYLSLQCAVLVTVHSIFRLTHLCY